MAKLRKIGKAERKRLDQRIERRKQKWRNRFKEIHSKKVDYVTHSYDEGYLCVTIYFMDGKNFSLDFTLAEPAVVPHRIEYGEMVKGDYQNLKTYLWRR